MSNFYTTRGEIRYAERVRSALKELGVSNAHFVIDVSRNGTGPQDDVCNPPGARIGQAPRLYQGGALDGLLWIKNPGESDGECRGSPNGFWPHAALGLLGIPDG